MEFWLRYITASNYNYLTCGSLPKELMQFWDFPFDTSLPSFVSHADVQPLSI